MTEGSTTSATGPEFDLPRFLGVLQRRRMAVAIIVLTLTTISVLRSLAASPTYTSTAELVVRPPTNPQFLDTLGTDSRNAVATEVRIVGSATVLDAAEAALGHRPDVSIRTRDESEVVEVVGRASTAKGAAETANVVAETYIRLRQERTTDQLTTAATELQRQYDAAQAQLNALPGTAVAPRQAIQTQIASLTAQLDQLHLAQAVTVSSGAEVISEAEPPGGPASPKPIRDAVLAIVTALVLGVGAALLLDRFDDSLRDAEQLAELSGLPVLGLVPVMPAESSTNAMLPAALSHPGSAFAESFRTLRTALRFLDLDQSHRTVIVTSPNPSDGKTTTVANLGVALAWTGRSVVVVSCDLRRGDLLEAFGIEQPVGLTSILLGEAEIETSLMRVAECPGLSLLPAGPVPPNPAEILGSERTRGLLDYLSSRFDHVLLDCPPVLAVSDSLALCASTGAPVLLVVRSGVTTTRELERTLELLGQVRPELLGTVLNRADLGDLQAGSYLYSGTDRLGVGTSVAADRPVDVGGYRGQQ